MFRNHVHVLFRRKHAIAENVNQILTSLKKFFYRLISCGGDIHTQKTRRFPILSRTMQSKTPTFIRTHSHTGKILIVFLVLVRTVPVLVVIKDFGS